MYLKTCETDIFLVLYEGYRIIASEWLVVNEYVKRELADIEFHLEKSESTFLQLENYLRELYRIRRRCNKDRELVMEAATQCKKRGQALWPSAMATPDGNEDAVKFAEERAQELVEDLHFVIDNMSTNISRVEKNITLLMGLVTISEGRQGLQENRAIFFLTLIATIFLPSETVATILAMQTQYGPGASNFWLLWAIALPLTVLIITIPYLYRTASATLNQLWAKYLQASSKEIPERPYGAPDENIELPDDPVHQLPQKSIHVVVEQV
jgi:Mg2+ and Co2+ transporter CorA